MGRHMSFSRPSKFKDISVLYRRENRPRKYTIEWTLESSLALIRAVQRCRHIWDPTSQYYRHRLMKIESWTKISDSIKIPKDETILRWNSLRGNYIAFLKKEKECKNDESANKLRRINPLYSEMGFLDPVLRTESRTRERNEKSNPSPVKSTAAVSISESSDSQALTPTPPLASTPAPTPTSQRPQTGPPQSEQMKNLSQQSTMGGMMMNAYDLLMKNVQGNDEWDAFGNMIASNARSWATENVGFARRYKAALAAVNAKFEQEAAELSA